MKIKYAAAMKIKHVRFNNAIGIDRVLLELEQEGWMLSYVVPYDGFESIAVFGKENSE